MNRLLPDGTYRVEPDAPKPSSVRLQIFIVTRFAVWIDGFSPPDSEEGDRAFHEWLSHREELFWSHCQPSVMRQTVRPDAWLLACDERRREALSDIVEKLAPHDWISPAWQRREGDIAEDHLEMLGREIEARLHPDTTHIATIRVDNDDGLHPEFVRFVRDYASAVLAATPDVDDFWITFPFGAQLVDDAVRMFVYPNNPFLSRIQTRSTFRPKARPTAFRGNHSKILERGFSVHLAFTRGPMWLQIVHDKNLRNQAKSDLPLLSEGMDLFDIKKR